MVLPINLCLALALALASLPLCAAASTDRKGNKYGESLRSDSPSKRQSSSHITGSNKEYVYRNRREQAADYCPMPQVREKMGNTLEK